MVNLKLLLDSSVESTITPQVYTFPEAMHWETAVRAVAETALKLQIETDTYIQIILPSRQHVRKTQHTNKKLKLLYHYRPVETDVQPLLSVYTMDSWFGKVLPWFLNSHRKFILCLVEDIEYNYRTELILKLFAQKKELAARLLWVPGPIFAENGSSYDALPIDITFDIPRAPNQIMRFCKRTTRVSEDPLFTAIIEHLDSLESRSYIKDVLLILPTETVMKEFAWHYRLRAGRKDWSLYLPYEMYDLQLQTQIGGCRRVYCVLAEHVYLESYNDVNCVIDTCLRRANTGLGTSQDVTAASRASINNIALKLSQCNENFVFCVCVESVVWRKMQNYIKTNRSSEELAFSIVQMENFGVRSELYVGDEPNYEKVVRLLLKYGLLVADDSTKLFKVKQRGRFALATELSPQSTAFLDLVFSDCRCWESGYSIYIACITAAWIDLQGVLLYTAPEFATAQTEYAWEDSLEIALDVFLSYCVDRRLGEFVGNKKWCKLRGVNWKVLYTLWTSVCKLIVHIERRWCVSIPVFPLMETYNFIETCELIDTKVALVPKLLEIFHSKVFKVNGQREIKNAVNQLQVWTVDPSVEVWTRKTLKKDCEFIAIYRDKLKHKVGKIIVLPQ